MKITYEEPQVTVEKDVCGYAERETHPSYAQIEVARVTHGADTPLYGSHTGHRQTVRLSISRSSVKRNLSTDWHHDECMPLVEVEMSETQFASMITGIGIGGGSCATLLFADGKHVPRIKPIDTKRRQFKREMMQAIEKDVSNHDALAEEIAALKISDKARASLLGKIDKLKNSAKSSANFIADQFDEFVEHTIGAAKQDIDAHLQTQIQRTGLDALGLPERQLLLS